MGRFFIGIAVVVLLLALAHTALAEGAVAVGKLPPRQWFGIAINKGTLSEARIAALSVCGNNGPNCTVLTTFRSTCIAVTWGETRGRAGYATTTRPNINDARSAALSNCYAHGMAQCIIKYVACDTVDEAAIASQRRREEQQAAAAAEQRRREAEYAAQQAEARARASRQAEEEARQRNADSNGRSTEASSSKVSSKKALGLGILLVAAIFIAILKQGHPHLAGWTAIIIPAASFILYALFGIEVKDEITLAEWPLFAPLFGGVVVAALTWKLHA